MLNRHNAALAAALLCAATLPAQPALTPARQMELLFDAARTGRADLVPAFKGTGTDLNARDSRGFTPLILAAYNGHVDTVDALILAGADACLPDTSQGNTALMGAAFRGHDGVARRLVAAGCPIDARNRAGQTALMFAALFGRLAQVEMLLRAGAASDAADASGQRPADLAEAQGNQALALILRRHASADRR